MRILEKMLEFNHNYITRNIDEIEKILLHHSGVKVLQEVETIHNYHKNTRGYAGIGYHFYVRKTGEVYKGRPIEWVGAHAYGSNYNSIGICAEGDYNVEEMPEKQKKAIIELIAYLKQECKNIHIVQAHRDVCVTNCPGDKFPFEEIVKSTTKDEITLDENKNENMGNVAKIQSTLNERYNLNIKVDNIYGNETRQALVKALQIELNAQFNKGLIIDGIFGTNTYNSCINVRKNAKGNITWLIQAMLYCKSFDLEIDGIFGINTENSIKSLQRRNNLIIDGICGKNTFKVLFK